MRRELLPFHVPSIGAEEIDEVVDTLESGWLTTGSKVARFEEAFCRLLGCEHAIAVSSGTAALHLALDAVGVTAGDHVIVPTLTFAATAEAVCYLGAVPRLVDVDPSTLTLDLERSAGLLERHRGERPRVAAVVPVHFGGYPCPMDALAELAREHGVAVVDDAAHALPCRYRGRPIGTWADATAFSFYATKPVTTGEGGMVTTADEARARDMRVASLHGISADAWMRYGRNGRWYYEITRLGYKYNLSDVAAAIGVHQLARCARLRSRREAIAARYTRAFCEMEAIELPPSTTAALRGDAAVEHAWHLYPILLCTERLGIDRATFIDELRARRIGTSVHFIPLHMHPYYRARFGYVEGEFPVAESFYRRCISLPIYPAMTDRDADDVVAAVADVAQRRKR